LVKNIVQNVFFNCGQYLGGISAAFLLNFGYILVGLFYYTPAPAALRQIRHTTANGHKKAMPWLSMQTIQARYAWYGSNLGVINRKLVIKKLARWPLVFTAVDFFRIQLLLRAAALQRDLPPLRACVLRPHLHRIARSCVLVQSKQACSTSRNEVIRVVWSSGGPFKLFRILA
jgi:hypothetical protein